MLTHRAHCRALSPPELCPCDYDMRMFLVSVSLYLLGFLSITYCLTHHWCTCGHLAHRGGEGGIRCLSFEFFLALTLLGCCSGMLCRAAPAYKAAFVYLYLLGLPVVFLWLSLHLLCIVPSFFFLYRGIRATDRKPDRGEAAKAKHQSSVLDLGESDVV